MSVRYETRFKYDQTDPKFFGTVLTTRHMERSLGGLETEFDPQGFKVLAQQPFQGVYTLDEPPGRGKPPPHEVPGKTEVAGEFWTAMDPGIDGSKFILEMSPWDMYIHAYDPMADARYVAKVLGIQVVSVKVVMSIHTCTFAAATLVRWMKKA